MMLKYFIYILLFVSNLSFAHDVDYYKTNPQEIEKALLNCSETHSLSAKCTELKKMADHMNDLAISLQLDPQGYGMAILKMQETVAKQINLKNKHQASPELLAEISKNQQDVFERLTIIKWLESPGKH